MNGLQQGQVVISKKGRDKGYVFVVVGLCSDVATQRGGEYAYLADGDIRKLGKPKKKKLKHILPTKYIDFSVKHKLENDEYINDADIRKAIKNREEE